MKNFCNAVLWVFFLALFANTQEAPPPLPNDSSLAVTQDTSPATTPDSSLAATSLPIAKAIEQEKTGKKAKEEKMPKKCNEPVVPEDYQKNLRPVAYLHPLSLFFGAANNMFMFNSTVEIPLSLSNSFVIQPTVWLGSSDEFISWDVKYEKLVRAGSGIGLRHYVIDKGYGFYLQAIAGAYYISAKSITYKELCEDCWDDNITIWKGVEGIVGELIFYIGASHKWQNIALFYECGLGFGYDGTKTYQFGYINKLATSFNLGVGIPLF